jgi:IS30 family transposase
VLRQNNTQAGDYIMAIIGYHHLTYEDRCQIYALKKIGTSNSAVAKQLGVNPSTIGRELNRNKGKRGYRYRQAQNFAATRKKKASERPYKMTTEIVSIIEKKLSDFQWSPEQISGWLKLNMKAEISHERIYQHIWLDKRNGGCLYKNLRHHGKKYNKRKGKNAGRGLIPNRIDIEERPKVVDEKLRIGDWEIDTIIGKNHVGVLVSMVDRTSKYTKLSWVENKKACVVTKAIEYTLRPLRSVVHTLTADNGKEFAMHEKISSSLQAKVYFAKPYRSWERGLNEHTNGLIRQYFPKKTCFDKLLPSDVQKVENLLNMRPRKILNFRTPLEVFEKAKIDLSKIALQS